MELMHKLITDLKKKLVNYSVDDYNENTYNFSQGYKRCLLDLIIEFESKL